LHSSDRLVTYKSFMMKDFIWYQAIAFSLEKLV
jgi:hypothetical protein